MKLHTAFEFLILNFSYKSSRSSQIPSLVKVTRTYSENPRPSESDIWKYKKRRFIRERLSTIYEKQELELEQKFLGSRKVLNTNIRY